jgi:hypothetical protein
MVHIATVQAELSAAMWYSYKYAVVVEHVVKFENVDIYVVKMKILSNKHANKTTIKTL